MDGLQLVTTSRERLADHLTPVGVLQALAGAGEAPGYLLESVEGGERWGRWSFVGADPILTVRGDAGGLSLTREGGVTERRDGAPLPLLEALLGGLASEVEQADPSRPPLEGAMVGYLGYDLVRTFEKVDPAGAPEALHPDLPLAALFLPGTAVAFDNLRHVVRLSCNQLLPRDLSPEDLARQRAGVEARLDALEARLQAGPARSGGPLLPVPRPGPVPDQAGFETRMSQADYEAAVREARERILAGEGIQVVLARAFESKARAAPFQVYRQLRALNPSPYLYYLHLPAGAGGESVEVAGSSPEVLVRREGDLATVRPIAGTRPRGATPAEDLALEEELRADPKEIAEHVMLVDLGRNDLGRVATAGSVRVRRQAVVERYSHVMHLVSEVQATLRPEIGLAELVASTFPAGTLSGAPKVRAMQIIDELEVQGRGLYGGAVGYLAPGGHFDLAICIRTLVQFAGRQWVQAGAGIVADSDPTREHEETLHKAGALFRAVQAALEASEGQGGAP
ncbi:MAG: anthranilate synthase component I family protein [Deltaproteobacteria bacterium]|nr:anthranilate synthase component I family protein [Deltaproteobacteria bacterium]